MDRERPSWFYRFIYRLVFLFFSIYHRTKATGRENIPPGGAIVCGNHSSYADPVLVAFAFSIKHQLHFMAKASLFKVPLLGAAIRKVGAFPVDRDSTDVTSARTALSLLKSGKKVVIFPEGTRVSEADTASAKRGAIVFALRCAVPIIPVYIPRKKPAFGTVRVRIGEPYYVELDRKTATNDDYKREAERLMKKIESLGERI